VAVFDQLSARHINKHRNMMAFCNLGCEFGLVTREFSVQSKGTHFWKQLFFIALYVHCQVDSVFQKFTVLHNLKQNYYFDLWSVMQLQVFYSLETVIFPMFSDFSTAA